MTAYIAGNKSLLPPVNYWIPSSHSQSPYAAVASKFQRLFPSTWRRCSVCVSMAWNMRTWVLLC